METPMHSSRRRVLVGRGEEPSFLMEQEGVSLLIILIYKKENKCIYTKQRKKDRRVVIEVGLLGPRLDPAVPLRVHGSSICVSRAIIRGVRGVIPIFNLQNVDPYMIPECRLIMVDDIF
jgi:hypothetical protein